LIFFHEVFRESPQGGEVFIKFTRFSSWQQDDVVNAWELVLGLAKGLSHQSLDTISSHGVSVPPADNQSQAGKFPFRRQVVDSQAFGTMALTVAFDFLEFPRCLDSLDGPKTIGGGFTAPGRRFACFHNHPIGSRESQPPRC